MTQQGQGGWVLSLRCLTCDATDAFRGVLLSLAADVARKAGWRVPRDARLLATSPEERKELCPKCDDALR